MSGKLAAWIPIALGGLFLLSPTARLQADALDDALALEGIERSDLGWSPPGWWSRYPTDIPHKLRHFDSLLAEPLAVVTFTRTAGHAARQNLSAEAIATVPKQADGAIYKAVHALGVERKFGAFRSYSANLTAKPVDIVDALLELRETAGRPTRFHTFGQDSPYPDLRGDLEEQAAGIPPEARRTLGTLVRNLVEARAWSERAFRNVSATDRTAVQSRWDLGEEMTDGLDYFAELDDAQDALDEASLWYGGLKAVAAVELASHELSSLKKVGDVTLDWNTPFGWIRIRGGGSDVIDGTGAFLVVDLGGDDRWTGGAGATGPGHGFSVALDVAGNDRYLENELPSQGAGLGGVGILMDREGEDRYRALDCSQGFGQLGLGVLVDLGGRDSYVARYSGQGSAFLGVGVLLEAAGDDRYEIQSDGQGFGGAGGVGTLADGSGDDRYEAIRDPEVTLRPSYHSEGKIAVSNAQGVGMGRRGDGSDGHSWAGGLGQLIDVSGDDSYRAGNWSMGTGYWFGTGLLWDGSGDDRYDGVIWTQGSGAHFCIGAVVDESGDDLHRVSDNGRSSLAFGHDFAVSLLVDVAGNDRYENQGDGLGFSINRSVAMLLDGGGNDRYSSEGERRPGFARYDKRFADRTGSYTYFAEASSVGLFLDVGGADRYEAIPLSDGLTVLDDPGSENRTVRNWSIASDVGEGQLDLRPLPHQPTRCAP